MARGGGGGDSGGTGRTGDSVRAALALVPVVAVLLSGCLGGLNQPPADPSSPTDEAVTPSKPPADLETSLYRLANADDPSSVATANGLRLEDGRVHVVIELAPDRALPDGFDVDVRSRHDRQVQAAVAIDDLVPLAGHANVSFVRPPDAAVTHDSDQ